MGNGTAGTLLVAGTGIGRPDDASPRLAAALAAAPVIAAEDTRRVRRLAADLGVRLAGRVVSYYDAVEAARTPGLIEDLRAGLDVLLVTDAGMPAVSDPGYRLVAAAATAGLPVRVLPGPSAVTAALAVSGLPSDRFCFEGFLPRKAGERSRRVASLADEPRTMVFFESRRRVGVLLSELAAAFGADRAAVLCRELTKTHEEIRRGGLGELAAGVAGEAGGAGAGGAEAGGAGAGGPVLGEITLVVAGAAGGGAQGTVEEAAAEVARRERAGVSRRDAVAAVAAERGLRRREVYNAVVQPGLPGPP
ncbi:MAG TPA: 16S rRNA (cytidine(1402)-2'-O)-methyltransferase [Streptosporangiaceae bacterium]|nr:16S rRNA (cytidine(1402)-2'-O)-methyltransferase [Streptosporangiaceae bacterium]